MLDWWIKIYLVIQVFTSFSYPSKNCMGQHIGQIFLM